MSKWCYWWINSQYSHAKSPNKSIFTLVSHGVILDTNTTSTHARHVFFHVKKSWHKKTRVWHVLKSCPNISQDNVCSFWIWHDSFKNQQTYKQLKHVLQVYDLSSRGDSNHSYYTLILWLFILHGTTGSNSSLRDGIYC